MASEAKGMFANATGYEQLMGRWSVRLAPLYTDFARLRDVGKILDVGCGTGALVKTIADSTREAEIVGVDPAQSFIDYARTRFSDSRITLQVGDAMALPFPAAHFDQALSLLVMMFVPQPERAASEMRRVTRPGGTVSACTWHRDELELTSIFWDEACKLDPGADARAQRPKHSNREGQLEALWRSAGLVDVEETAIAMDLPFKSFNDFWEPHLRGVAPQGAYVASLSEERREAFRRALHNRILGGRQDGAFTLKAKALAVRGTVP
jgi:SAM-dependent methyltransferase